MASLKNKIRSLLHLQSIVQPDELFHSILPGMTRIIFILDMVIMMDCNLTCPCHSTMSSHSMGSPSDSSPILHPTYLQLGLRRSLLSRLSWSPSSSGDSGPVLRTAGCGEGGQGGRGCESTCSSPATACTLCVQPLRISCCCFLPSAS